MRQYHFFPDLCRCLEALVMLLASVTVMADGPVQLNIHLVDGTVESIQLYTRPQVTFESDRVIFTSSVATFSYDAQQVLRFTYSGGSLSDKVASPDAGDLFRQQGEQILFDVTIKASDVQLFSEDGKRLPATIQTANGRPSLSLKHLPAGVYVLSVNGRTSKVVKK